MRFSLVCLLPFVLQAHAVIAQGSLSEICAGVGGLSGCKVKMSVPTGYKVITKRKAYKKLNKCKTKKSVKVNCGTQRNPKTCTKKVCQKGYDVKYKNVPSRLQIKYTKVDLCSSVRKVLGTTLGNKFIKSRDAICGCFPRLRKLNSEGKFKAASAGEFTSANINILDQSTTLQSCLGNAGLALQHNKNEALNQLKSAGWTVAVGAEIDTSTFKAMIAAVAPCRAGSCNKDLITRTFTNYLKKVYKTFSAPLAPIMLSWEVSLGWLKSYTIDLLNASENIQQGYDDTYNKIFEYYDAVCSPANWNWCTDDNPGTQRFMDNALNALAAAHSLGRAKGVLEDRNVLVLLDDFEARASDFYDNVAGIPSTHDMVTRIQANDFKSTKDIIKFIPVAHGVPDFAKEVTAKLEPLKNLRNEYGTTAKGLRDLLQEMIDIDWPLDFRHEFEEGPPINSPSEFVLWFLHDTQKLLKENLIDAVKTFDYHASGMQDQLEQFSLTNGRFKVQTGTFTFRRWSTLRMDMPCSKIVTKTYKKSGLTKKSNGYREFWKCRYGPQDAQYPQVHVPYMKIQE
ncbi:Fc.00g055430.m01.CDS01 [Cosmosporella sp. VM-42]